MKNVKLQSFKIYDITLQMEHKTPEIAIREHFQICKRMDFKRVIFIKKNFVTTKMVCKQRINKS